MSKMPKFRAWDKKYKMLMRVNQIDFLKGTAWLEADQGDHETRHTLTRCFDDLIFMQSTGLKDKNGVAIFEGDIVAYDDYEFSYTAIVKKETYYFWLKGIEPDDAFHLEDISDEYDGTTDLTVIGNIYEQPELLGGQP